MQQLPVAVATVVIVDDEVDHAVIIRRVLSDVAPDVTVQTLTDPLDIEERLHALPQGVLVLMDRNLGVLDSIPIIGRLLRARPDFDVVLLSAALSTEDRDHALRVGAIAAMEKPGSLRAWREMLRDLLDMHAARPVD